MLDYFALFLLFFVATVIFYGIIAIHDIPYEISKQRNHPHQDAIHVAGWVSLFTLHILWPLLWIWAMLYRPDRGWGMVGNQDDMEGFNKKYQEELKKLKVQHQHLLVKLKKIEQSTKSSN